MSMSASYWHNAYSLIKLIPSISMGARIAHCLARQENKAKRREIGLQLGYNLWKDGGIFCQGRVIFGQEIRTVPRVAEFIKIDTTPIYDSLVATPTTQKKFAFPRVTSRGLWIAFGLLIQPKKLRTTLKNLEEKYNPEKKEEGTRLLDLQTAAQTLQIKLAAKEREIAGLNEQVESGERLVDFAQQITQKIFSGAPYEEFVHAMCDILWRVSGLKRCVALTYNKERDALVAEGVSGAPNNPWASEEPENTAEIEAFTYDEKEGRSILVVPLTVEGQKAMAGEMIVKAAKFAVRDLPGSTVARRILFGMPGIALTGKMVMPKADQLLADKELGLDSESILTRVFKIDQTLVVNDTARPEHPVSKILIRMWGSKTFIVTPIRVFFLVPDEKSGGYKMERRVVGVFAMDHDQYPQQISEAVKRRVELLTDMASIGFTLHSYTRALETALGRHLGPKITKEIISKMMAGRPTELAPQPARCSIMFTDIVKFTRITEKLKEEQLAKFLIAYRNWIDKFIFEHDGILDKYIGDAHLVAWGTPVAKHEDDAERSLRAAMVIQREVDHFMKKTEWGKVFEEVGLPPLKIRIGIDTGEVMAGLLASGLKHEYTVIGDAVNRANRMEGAAGDSGILISESTYKELGEDFIKNYCQRFNEAIRKWLREDFEGEFGSRILEHFQDIPASELFKRKSVPIKLADRLEEVVVYQVEWDRKKVQREFLEKTLEMLRVRWGPREGDK